MASYLIMSDESDTPFSERIFWEKKESLYYSGKISKKSFKKHPLGLGVKLHEFSKHILKDLEVFAKSLSEEDTDYIFTKPHFFPYDSPSSTDTDKEIHVVLTVNYSQIYLPQPLPFDLRPISSFYNTKCSPLPHWQGPLPDKDSFQKEYLSYLNNVFTPWTKELFSNVL